MSYNMHFESRSSPSLYGQFPGAFLYNPYINQIPFSLPYDLNRLYHEKDLLSKGLADCVTYLKALREKQTKCIYQLNLQPSLPQKKRKRLQQSRKYLDNEVKNRSLAEQAYLSNLQACEMNIHLANIKAYGLSAACFHAHQSISTSTLYTPTLCSNSGSEATDLTWDGWTDETELSPFQRKSYYPFAVEDFAPDAYKEAVRRDSVVAKDVKCPPPLCRDAFELWDSLPAPPNTACSQYMHSTFPSPAAPCFKPTYSSVVQRSSHPQSSIKKLSISSAAAANTIELLHKRRFSTAEIVPIMERFNIVAQSPPHYLPDHRTWGRTAPPTCPRKVARPPMNRQRTNSL